jgi:hypothetical protein
MILLVKNEDQPQTVFSARPIFFVHEQTGETTTTLLFSINNEQTKTIENIRNIDLKETSASLRKYAGLLHLNINSNKKSKAEKTESDKLYYEFAKHSAKLYRLVFGKNKELADYIISLSKKPSKLVVASNQFGIPFELINVSEKESFNEVELFADYFFISRIYPKKSLGINTAINLSYAYHPKLEGTKKELAFFERSDDDDSLKFKLVRKIEGGLKELFEFTNGDSIDFVHLSCHLETEEEDPSDSYLDFESFEIKLSDFEFISEHNTWKNKILFVNSCDSGTPQYLRKSNMASYFFETGIDLLICVGIKIYDDFAGDYTERLYNNLLNFKKPITIQEVIYLTSNFYWKTQKNPLGFFYFSIGSTKTFSLNGKG